jgi:diguanylate cyclase (GGDEF)-like protein
MEMAAIEALHEQGRLDALARYDILDTPREEAFDRITRLVRRILKVSMATVVFLDGHRQWFKSREGVVACEGPRSDALCNFTIRKGVPLVVPDTLADGRFCNNPLVMGAPHLRFYAGVPLRSSDGHSIGTLCAMDTIPRRFDPDDLETLSDLAQIVMNELDLRLVASIDSLTGALARGSFRDEAARALALAQRHRYEASCIAFDLDHFKLVNDRHGHPCGDAVLAGSVAACRRLLRQTDLLGRVGGEEFAVVLPHTGLQAALNVAEKLREGIAAQVFEGAEGPLAVTASFGVTTTAHTTCDLDAMLRAADEALYAAKTAGRNRCIAGRSGDGVDAGLGRRVLKAGRIVFNGGGSVIDCTVRRLSDQGANLAVISTAGLPDRFKLAIESDAFSRLCKIARKAGTEIDVQFA